MDTIEAMVAERPRAMDPEEWKVRVDLAACYRLIAHFGCEVESSLDIVCGQLRPSGKDPLCRIPSGDGPGDH